MGARTFGFCALISIVTTIPIFGCGSGDCEPDCVLRECGPDGCGGTCGTCEGLETCNDEEGICQCAFSSCGDACCGELEVCYEGSCCAPSCDPGICGPDGCGGFCDGDCQFVGQVRDWMSSIGLSGKTCRVLDNDTGEPVAGSGFTSGAEGIVRLGGLTEGLVGFHCDKTAGEFIDTYQFNFPSTAQDASIWLVDLGVYQLGPTLAGFIRDPSRGFLIGSATWINPDGEPEPVGCATIVSASGGELRYFGGNNLPVKTTADDPGGGRDSTHPTNGLFLVANMEPGRVSLTLEVDGEVVGTMETITYGENQAITVNDIHVDESYTSNPTPDVCN